MLELGIAILVSAVLMLLIWVPFFRKEIVDGKGELGPLRRMTSRGVVPGPVTPSGAGDNNPGRVGDPAPGEPSGQPDPWGERAQRQAPSIRS